MTYDSLDAAMCFQQWVRAVDNSREKDDLVELDSSPTSPTDVRGVGLVGALARINYQRTGQDHSRFLWNIILSMVHMCGKVGTGHIMGTSDTDTPSAAHTRMLWRRLRVQITKNFFRHAQTFQ